MYPHDFSASTEAGLGVLAAVQNLLDPAAAASLAERWEQQFAIAEAWAEHRQWVREAERKLGHKFPDFFRGLVHEVDENWRRDPLQMLANARKLKTREAMLQEHPERHQSYRQIQRRMAIAEVTVEWAEAETARLDALWLTPTNEDRRP